MRSLVSLALAVALGAAAAPLASLAAQETLTDACQCDHCHGEYRWAAKTSKTAPPASIAADHKLKPSDIYALPGPGGTFTKSTPRIGDEKLWYQVTGRVTHLKVEEDGDLHVQLLDADVPTSSTTGYLVVEIPDGAPWCALRARVLGWTNAHFPLDAHGGKKLTMRSHPVVRVTGRAFYDAIHAPHGETTRNARPVVGGNTGAIWEIHPVMRLAVVKAH